MGLRTDFTDALRAALPPTWKVYGYGPMLDNPQHVTLICRQKRVEPTKGAPRRYRDAGFTIALVEPGIDPLKVEDALDNDVETLLDALEALPFPGLQFESAERVLFDNRFHGYDVAVTITTEPSQEQQ